MSLAAVQQQLLSFFNLTKVATLDATLSVFKEIITELNIDCPPTEKQFLEDLSKINRKIKKYDLEIVESIDEITCEKLFLIINTSSNFTTQKSNFYNADTSNFFPIIIKECILSEKGSISETYCLNLSAQARIKKAVAESIIQELITDKWLVYEGGKISLGMRTIVELEQNIKQFYPDDVKHCLLCKLIVVQGIICSSCHIRYHNACWKRHTHSKSSSFCPNCKANVEDASFNESIEDSQEFENPHSPVLAPAKRRKRSLLD